jgi:hypothetical protein
MSSELYIVTASKCDDISCGEVIRALHLEDDPQLEDIEEKLSVLERDSSSSKRQKKGAEKLVKGDLKIP